MEHCGGHRASGREQLVCRAYSGSSCRIRARLRALVPTRIGQSMSSKHLRRLCQTLFILLLAQPAVLADSHLDAIWFYMVKSRPSEPAREAEYNTWYEDIDIPDVLAVPGFVRARRAIVRDSTEVLPTDAGYAAFYDIDTVDIDKRVTFFSLHGKILDKICGVFFVIVPILTLLHICIMPNGKGKKN